jgi:hypothetical protein
MDLTKVISSALDSIGRRLTKIRRYSKDDTQTGFETSPFGTDANPIAGMVAIYAETSVKGKQVVIGYINRNQLAQPGEHRIFSTDADGNLKFSIWLKADGTCEIGGNANHLTRFEDLQTGFNQLLSDFNAHVHASNGAPPTTPSSASITNAKIDQIKTL